MPLVSLESGKGLPGTGVLLLGRAKQEDGSIVGSRFFCLGFLPLVPLGRVRLVRVQEHDDLFDLVHEGPVPVRDTLMRWLRSLGLAAIVLGPGAYILPRIHETGVLPGLRLVAAVVAALLVLAMADLSASRLAPRSPRP